jgi:hypothetical protein
MSWLMNLFRWEQNKKNVVGQEKVMPERVASVEKKSVLDRYDEPKPVQPDPDPDPDPEPEDETAWLVPSSVLESGNEIARAIVSLSILQKSEPSKSVVPRALMLVIQTEELNYQVVVLSQGRQKGSLEGINVLLRQRIWSGISFSFRPHLRTVTWSMLFEHKVIAIYAKFVFPEGERRMVSAWTRASIESGRQEKFNKVIKPSDEEWVMKASEDSDEDDDVEESEEEESDEEEKTTAVPKLNGRRNKSLLMGLANHNAYVTRGSSLGVFKNSKESEMEYVTSVKSMKTAEGEDLCPSYALLHQQDTKLMMLNPEKTTRVYEMDLEKQKIIQEYGVSDDWHIGNIGHMSKYAQLSSESGLVAVNNNSVFNLDPRQSGHNKMGACFSYAYPTQFTCVVTTGTGAVAVGSETGEIRLFNDISKRSKTLLAGLGHPIIHMDVTEDGTWLLATTKHYLLLISTVNDVNQRSGFNVSLSSGYCPPIKLQLTSSDLVKYNITKLSLTPAYFNTGGTEVSLVTSTGPYLITWDFNRAKKGHRHDYKIKTCRDQVISNQFIHDQTDRVVVTLPDDICLVKRKS